MPDIAPAKQSTLCDLSVPVQVPDQLKTPHLESRFPAGSRKTRILHVVGGMQRGGAETWLMHVLRALDRDRYQMDFLVHTLHECAFDKEILGMGSKILHCPITKRPDRYALKLRRLLRENGSYDVLHSHVHYFSGLVLGIARSAGIPIRVAHSHNDTRGSDSNSGFLRLLYLHAAGWAIRQYATLGLAASREAAKSLYGPNWEAESRWRVLYCGIDLEAFRQPCDRAAVRAALGIPRDAIVVGHVGRFDPQKNHQYFLKVACEVAKRAPQASFLLVGDGPLRPSIETGFVEANLAGRTVFAGLRSDVAQLMQGAMDVLLFPSLFEGLPLVLLEAQAAGLPAVISNAISAETDVLGGLFQRLPLSADPRVWADTTVDLAIGARPSPDKSVAAMARTAFNAQVSTQKLIEQYGVRRAEQGISSL